MILASAWMAAAQPQPSLGAGAAVTPSAEPAFKERPPYRIGPGDVLAINVWKEPEITQASVTVLPDGKVNLALVGQVPLAGMTLQEAEQKLVELFKPVITDPEITVTVKEPNSQRVFIVGAVRKEGPIKLVTEMTVLQAIAESGGLTEFARKAKIYVMRKEGNKQVNLPFDYSAVLRGQNQEQNIVLRSGDTIVVPH